MRLVLVPLIPMTFALALIILYKLYEASFHETRRVAIERDLSLIDRTPSEELARLRRAIGSDLDALPPVRIRSVHDANLASTGNSVRERESRDAETRAACLFTGAFVSPRDDFVDCASYCKVEDGVAYKFIDEVESMLREGSVRTGSYCVPTAAVRCNTNTSLLVYGRDEWRCLPQTRAFAGEGGNKIVACDGNLLDRSTGRVWRDSIDHTLRFSSVDELMGDGSYRFVCPPSTDRLGNPRIPCPLDRLYLLENYCASVIPYASLDIRPNFETGACVCDDNTRPDPQTGICMPLSIGRDSTTGETIMSVDRCVEFWTVRSTLPLGDAISFPCGIENSDASASYPACVGTRALTSHVVAPSPYAMRESALLGP